MYQGTSVTIRESSNLKKIRLDGWIRLKLCTSAPWGEVLPKLQDLGDSNEERMRSRWIELKKQSRKVPPHLKAAAYGVRL